VSELAKSEEPQFARVIGGLNSEMAISDWRCLGIALTAAEFEHSDQRNVFWDAGFGFV
jgi:hypothetical protein